MAIVLQESLRALFYAPFYVALAQSAYAAAGWTFVSPPRLGRARQRAGCSTAAPMSAGADRCG